MNKTENKLNFKAFLTLLTALVLSLVLCFAVSCGNSSESNSTSESETTSESTSEEKDEQLIPNGNFEFHVPESTTKFPYYSSSNIKWTRTNGTSSSDVNSGVIDVTKSDFSDVKLPKENGETISGTKVLMLQNKNQTAQYFTSSTTLTLEHGKDALLTVWVKTENIESKFSAPTGAYVQVKNTIGTSVHPTIIDNIVTPEATEENNNGWVKYSIYLRGSDFAVSKFQVVLGLGHGNNNDKGRLLKGTAFFDNVTYTVLDDNSEFDSAKAAASADAVIDGGSFKKEVTDENDFILDGTITTAVVDFSNASTSFDTTANASKSAFNDYNNNNRGQSEADIAAQKGFSVNAENGTITFDFVGSSNPEFGSSYTYSTLSAPLAAYDKANNADNDDVNDYKGIMISFKANVDVKRGSTGAFVKVIDTDSKKATDALEIASTDGDERFAIYLSTNRTSVTYALQITFGPTSNSSDNRAFPVGTATFSDFTVTALTEWQFSNVDTTNAKTLQLLGGYLNDVEDDDTDSDDADDDSYTINSTVPMGDDNVSVGISNVSGYTSAKVEGNIDAKLVNSKFTYSEAGLNDALNGLKADIINPAATNKEVQPIALIKNAVSEKDAFVQLSEVTVSANSVYKFVVKIRVHSGSAFVRLFNAGAEYDSTLGTSKFDVDGTSYEMKAVVTKDSKKNTDGYSVVTFVVKTGDNAKNLMLQIGFGGDQTGIALIGSTDSGSDGSSLYSNADSVINAFEAAEYQATTKSYKYSVNDGKIFYYENEEDAKADKNRIQEEDANGKKVDKYDESPVEDVVLLLKDQSGSALVQYYRYDTIETKHYVIEAADDDSESDSESDSNVSSANKSYVWLQVVSIILAVVLIAALVAVIVRMALKNRKAKIKKTASRYDDKNAPDHKKVGYDAKKYSRKKIVSNDSSSRDIVAPDDTDAKYNYSNDEDKVEETTPSVEENASSDDSNNA